MVKSPFNLHKIKHLQLGACHQLVVVILILSCGLFISQQIEAKSNASLEFTISFDKEEYKLKDSISINFKLKNKGKKPIYVNKRFFVNSEQAKPQQREVYLRVSGPAGEQLPCKASYETGFPKTDYFVLLEPKAELTPERKKNLKAYFDLKDPGEYNVIAVYQNVYGPEIGIDAFQGKITSKPVTIEIK